MLKKFILFFCLAAGAVVFSDSYNFYMISDTHFGAPESFPKAWTGKKKYRIPPFPKRAEVAMPVYEALFKDIQRKADQKTQFLLDCGDFVEGAAKDAASHKAELKKALALLNKHISLKIYHVRGNHDNYGPGGDEAFDAVMLPVISRSIGKEKMTGVNYDFSLGKDHFIVLDYERRSNWQKFLKTTLSGFKTPPRYLFVAIHTPLISNWSPVLTEKICDLLLPYNTILLSGHIHSNTITKYSKNGKTLTQVTVSTMLPQRPQGNLVCVRGRETLEQYKNRLVDGEKRPNRKEAVKKWLPYLSDFIRIRGGGYIRFEVSDKGVVALYQGSNLSRPPCRVVVVSREVKK